MSNGTDLYIIVLLIVLGMISFMFLIFVRPPDRERFRNRAEPPASGRRHLGPDWEELSPPVQMNLREFKKEIDQVCRKFIEEKYGPCADQQDIDVYLDKDGDDITIDMTCCLYLDKWR